MGTLNNTLILVVIIFAIIISVLIAVFIVYYYRKTILSKLPTIFGNNSRESGGCVESRTQLSIYSLPNGHPIQSSEGDSSKTNDTMVPNILYETASYNDSQESYDHATAHTSVYNELYHIKEERVDQNNVKENSNIYSVIMD